MKYRIEARHEKDYEWIVIDDSNHLGEIVRWFSYYITNVSKGWRVKMTKLVKAGQYETIS